MSTNSKNAIQEIKKLMKQFGFLSKEVFLDAKLKDGTAIKVEGDSVIEGAKVMVVTAEGDIPAPDGVHELEDGSKVETKDAIIVKLEPAMEEEKPEIEIEVAAKEKMEEVVEDVPVADAGDPVEVEMMDMLKDFVKKMSEKMASMEKKMYSIEENFESFKKEPAGKKIADGKTEFNKVSKNSENDLIAGIMRLREINN